MNWKFETQYEYEKRVVKYRRWFAWYPVAIDGRMYWLETVLRREKFYHSTYADWSEFHYQPIVKDDSQ